MRLCTFTVEFHLAEHLEIKQQLALLMFYTVFLPRWRVFESVRVYLHLGNIKDESKELEENGDKMEKYYRWEENTKETWKRREVRNVTQQMKSVSFSFSL
jgi:hypothetical protein